MIPQVWQSRAGSGRGRENGNKWNSRRARQEVRGAQVPRVYTPVTKIKKKGASFWGSSKRSVSPVVPRMYTYCVYSNSQHHSR